MSKAVTAVMNFTNVTKTAGCDCESSCSLQISSETSLGFSPLIACTLKGRKYKVTEDIWEITLVDKTMLTLQYYEPCPLR